MRFLLGPQGLHEQDVLAQDFAATRVIEPVVAHLFDAPAITDAEIEAPPGEKIQARDFLREPDRVTLRNQCDAGTKPDALSHRGRRGQRDEGIVRTP